MTGVPRYWCRNGIEPGSIEPRQREPITNSLPSRKRLDERRELAEVVRAVRVAHQDVAPADVREGVDVRAPEPAPRRLQHARAVLRARSRRSRRVELSTIRISPATPAVCQALLAPVDELADGELLVERRDDDRELGLVDVVVGHEEPNVRVGGGPLPVGARRSGSRSRPRPSAATLAARADGGPRDRAIGMTGVIVPVNAMPGGRYVHPRAAATADQEGDEAFNLDVASEAAARYLRWVADLCAPCRRDVARRRRGARLGDAAPRPRSTRGGDRHRGVVGRGDARALRGMPNVHVVQADLRTWDARRDLRLGLDGGRARAHPRRRRRADCASTSSCVQEGRW